MNKPKSNSKNPKPSEDRYRHRLWFEEVMDSVGRLCTMETVDGARRSGKITALRMKNIYFNGEKQEFPISVELNGDPTDCVPLDRLASLSIQ